MSRQRLRPSLGESSQTVCPRCRGQGTIRGVESLGLSILRIIEEEAMKESTGRIIVQVPVKVATFLLNEKRRNIVAIEHRQDVEVLLLPNQHLETPDYEIERVRVQDMAEESDEHPSYQIATQARADEVSYTRPGDAPRPEEPAVKQITPPAPAPQRPEPVETPALAATAQAQPHKDGLLKRIFSTLFPPKTAETTQTPPGGAAGSQNSRQQRGQAEPSRANHPGDARRQPDRGGRTQSGQRQAQSGDGRRQAQGDERGARGTEQDRQRGERGSRRGGRGRRGEGPRDGEARSQPGGQRGSEQDQTPDRGRDRSQERSPERPTTEDRNRREAPLRDDTTRAERLVRAPGQVVARVPAPPPASADLTPPQSSAVAAPPADELLTIPAAATPAPRHDETVTDTRHVRHGCPGADPSGWGPVPNQRAGCGSTDRGPRSARSCRRHRLDGQGGRWQPARGQRRND